MIAPFTPVGERARWRYLYDLVSSREPGQHVTYREAIDALGGVELFVAQAAMREAMTHLEADGLHTVRTSRRFGWIVLRPGEHVGAAQHHLGKAKRAGRRALSKLDAIEKRRDVLTQEERREADLARLSATAIQAFGRRTPLTWEQMTAATPSSRKSIA